MREEIYWKRKRGCFLSFLNNKLPNKRKINVIDKLENNLRNMGDDKLYSLYNYMFEINKGGLHYVRIGEYAYPKASNIHKYIKFIAKYLKYENYERGIKILKLWSFINNDNFLDRLLKDEKYNY